VPRRRTGQGLYAEARGLAHSQSLGLAGVAPSPRAGMLGGHGEGETSLLAVITTSCWDGSSSLLVRLWLRVPWARYRPGSWTQS